MPAMERAVDGADQPPIDPPPNSVEVARPSKMSRPAASPPKGGELPAPPLPPRSSSSGCGKLSISADGPTRVLRVLHMCDQAHCNHLSATQHLQSPDLLTLLRALAQLKQCPQQHCRCDHGERVLFVTMSEDLE